MISRTLYVGLSGQVALQERLDTVANNVANSATSGFRAEEIKFETVLSEQSKSPAAFAVKGDSYLSRRAGEFVQTGNPLDVAIRGEAWLAIQTPAGIAYTRDGRFQSLPTGELQTIAGNSVLDEGGAPILLNPNGGPPSIAADGTITQSNRTVGQLGLFTIAPEARLERYGNASVIPDRGVEAAARSPGLGVAQGFIERSNVNSVNEMSKMITISRSFDALSNALADAEQALRSAIEKL